eukprot:g6645.t1
MYEALTLFLKKSTTIVEDVPVLGQVAKLFTTIYEIYDQTTSNVEEAKEAMERCKYLANIIIQCLGAYDKIKQPLKETQMKGLKLLFKHTEEMVKLVQSYCGKHFVSKATASDDFKSQYKDINKHIDDALQMVQLGVATTMLQQNNDLLEMLSSKTKLDANNTKELRKWIKQYGTIPSATIELKEIISEEGANGVVCRGIKDEYLQVAVKVISVEKSFTWENSKNDIFRETFIGMMFQHPNMVRTLGCVYDQKPSANKNGKLMIVMEYMENGSLHSFIKAKHQTLTKADRHALASNAADGIYGMHQKHICHHDIKPGNMLLDDRFNVKICDLDAAKDLAAATQKTTKSVVGGHTTQYTAPEYLKGGKSYDNACDVFSFAMSMYEVATGKAPFEGKTQAQITTELVTNDARPGIPDDMYDLVDGEFIHLMQQAWSTNPGERPTMKKIAKTLHKICKESGTSQLQVPNAAQRRQSSSSSEDVERAQNKLLEERRKMEEELTRMKREAEEENRRLRKQYEDQLKAADAERARQQHENNLKETRLREEKEKEKALRLENMKRMPVIKRTKKLLNEISKLPSVSEARSKFTQYEEYARNLKSLTQRHLDATKNMTQNVENENERRTRLKKKWGNDLKVARDELEKAKESTNISKIKSMRKLINEIKGKINSLSTTDVLISFGTQVENIKDEIETKESIVKELFAIGNTEFQVYLQCKTLEDDLNKEIKTAAMLEEEEYDEERLDELGKCKQSIVEGIEGLLARPFVNMIQTEKERKRENEKREREMKEQVIKQLKNDKEKRRKLWAWIGDQINKYRALSARDIYNVKLKYGKKVCLCSSQRINILHNACIANDTNVVRNLVVRLSNIDINELDKSGNTAMKSMLIEGGDHIDIFKLIHLFNMNEINVSRLLTVAKEFNRSKITSYIEWISSEKVDLKIVKQFIDLHLLKYNCYPALHKACEKNDLDTVKFLLEVIDVGINSMDSNGKTGTYLAAYNGNNSVVTYLLSKGGREDDVTKGKLDNKSYKKEFPKGTPLVCACEKGRVEDVEGMIRGARAAGMDVTAMVSEVGTDSYGTSWTPLMAAAYYERSTIIEILLQYNADTAITYEDGKKPSNDYESLNEKYKKEFPKGTPFVCACQKGRVEDVEGMIRGARAAGMDVTAMVSEVGRSSRGHRWTPLMMAAEHSLG